MAWNRRLFFLALLGSLALSVGLTALAWWFGWPFFGAFLFLPFIPFMFRRGPAPSPRACPRCGWATVDEELHFCPRDGERLGS